MITKLSWICLKVRANSPATNVIDDYSQEITVYNQQTEQTDLILLKTDASGKRESYLWYNSGFRSIDELNTQTADEAYSSTDLPLNSDTSWMYKAAWQSQTNKFSLNPNKISSVVAVFAAKVPAPATFWVELANAIIGMAPTVYIKTIYHYQHT